MNPIVAALVVIVILQMVALVVAVVARLWVLRTATFELHGTDVASATDLVAFYVQGVHDHRFGFPTGIFRVDPEQTAPGRVLAREVDVQGSAGYGPIRAGLMLPLAGLAAGIAMGNEGDSWGVALVGGMLGFALGCAAAVAVIVPCAFVTVVELLLRVLMRAEIRASIEPVPGDAQSVRVDFELRGPSAFGIERQLRRGMRAPHRPDAPPPPDPVAAAGPASSFDRLGTLYAASATVALICSVVAIVLIGNAEHHPANAVAASSSYTEEQYGEEPDSEPYEDEPYESEPYEEERGGAGHESEAGRGAGAAAPTPTRFDAARAMLRRYWTLIDDGEYAAAYAVYYPTYATQEDVSKSDFVESEHEYLPAIGLDRMTVKRSERSPTSPAELWLCVEVPIQDTVGEFAGECRLFYGDVRMFHADGRWYYRPGEAFGRKPSFGQEGGGIRTLPAGSYRCS